MAQPTASGVHSDGIIGERTASRAESGAISNVSCPRCGHKYLTSTYARCPRCPKSETANMAKAASTSLDVDAQPDLDRAHVAIAIIEALDLTPEFAARYDGQGTIHAARGSGNRTSDPKAIRKALAPLLDAALVDDSHPLADDLLDILLTVTKHGGHDQKSHGNWARGGGRGPGSGSGSGVRLTGDVDWDNTLLDEHLGERTATAYVESILAGARRQPHETEFQFQTRVLNQFDPATKSAVMAGIRERYAPDPAVVDAAAKYRAAHNLPEPQVDYDSIVRDDHKAERVAAAYIKTPDQSHLPEVQAAYSDFKRQNAAMYDVITRDLGITVEFVKEAEPYTTAEAQRHDVTNNKRLKIADATILLGIDKGGRPHPLMSNDEYNVFRAVHDVFGHVAIGGGFDRHGEYAAWVAHNSMYTGAGRVAMSSEYHGTNSVLTTGGVAETKAVLLPDDLIATNFDDSGAFVRKAMSNAASTSTPVAALDLDLSILTSPSEERAAVVRAIAKARRESLIAMTADGTPGAATLLAEDRAEVLCAAHSSTSYSRATYLTHCDDDVPIAIAKAFGFAGMPYPGEFIPPSTTVFRPDPRLHSHAFKPDPMHPNRCIDCGKGTGTHSRMVYKPDEQQEPKDTTEDDERKKEEAAIKLAEAERKRQVEAAKLDHEREIAEIDMATIGSEDPSVGARRKAQAKIRLLDRMKTLLGLDQPVKKDAPSSAVDLDPDLSYAVVKSDVSKRFTLGPMYIPNRADAHGEFATPEDLQAATWGYVKETGADRRIYLQHSDRPAGEWVEIMAWPYEVEATMLQPGSDGVRKAVTTTLPAGTVYMGVIWEPWAYDDIRKGRLTGFSMGGVARRRFEMIPEATTVIKHGSGHDEKSHGNWAHGGHNTPATSGSGRPTRAHMHLKDGSVLVTNVDDAVKLLSEGVKITLRQPREVSTLLDRLAKIAQDAKAKGEKAPLYNLCNVSVKGTNLFCAQSKGVPRSNMPQLKGVPIKGSKADALPRDERGEVNLNPLFREHLIKQGIKVTTTTERAEYLRATQNELNGEKVAGIMGAYEAGKLADETLFVSHDNYVVDGHHRWASQVGSDLRDNTAGDVIMKIDRIDADILTILDMSNKFAEEWGIPQAGVAAGFGVQKWAGLEPECVGC